jgi:hypothetical protein
MPLIPDAKVAQRYGVVLRTLARWDANRSLGFPAPTVINKRKYRDSRQLDEFDRTRALASTQRKINAEPLQAQGSS